MEIDKTLMNRKSDLLDYFRERAVEPLREITQTYGVKQKKERAKAVNSAMVTMRATVIKSILSQARNEGWTSEDILRAILMTKYTNYVVMIEYRNDVWPYEYMTFSRRIGELWEPFCKRCFDYPLRDLQLFVPPVFSDIKRDLTNEVFKYIDNLSITAEEKDQLKSYYNQVWSYVASGEIKLELDLHFQQGTDKFVVDFKSGFGSNEKGNTNRLLLVATIYKHLEPAYRCLLFVRAEEDQNNNYFRTLKNSGVWEAYCGGETYKMINEYSGFDIRGWMDANIDWKADLNPETIQHFKDAGLLQYLKW